MALPYELAVAEDLNIGHGTVAVTMPAGGTATGNKVGLHTFNGVFNVKHFGAVGDGVADDGAAINAALTAAATSGYGATFAPPGIYKSSITIVVPAGVLFYGIGRLSKLASAIPAASSCELVRLHGDHAAIEKLWLTGRGQVTNTADGNRGIWIGSGLVPHAVTAYTDYARVEDCHIDQFTGNGISGDYRYARIVHNTIQNTTDACLFLQPSCVFNLVSGNTLTGCRYSGIDCNGSDNRIVNNYCAGNGGGNLDQGSWNGILICYINGAAVDPNANRNIVEGNRCVGNQGSGILVLGASASGTTPIAPYGNIVRGNICTGHTNFVGRSDWGAGICVLGASNTIVSGNTCDGNTFNYVVCGSVVGPITGVQVVDNQSINALTNATLTGLGQPSGVGYFFPGSGRIDGAGGNTVQHLVLSGNWDRYAASDAYRIDLALGSAVNWTGWTISDNHFDTPGGWGFNLVSPGSFLNYFLSPSNYGTGAASGSFNGFASLGFTANSATPAVANGRLWKTQNSAPTSYTNFTGAVPGQEITIVVNDAFTTFDFTGTTLKGNAGADFIASSGDVVRAIYDGTNWYCTIFHIYGLPTGQGNGVTQSTNKSTTVTNNYISGLVTMNAASLAADTEVSFTLNNSFIGASDQVRVQIIGGPNAGSYTVSASITGAGAATVTVRNVSAGALTDAVVVGFFILKQ